MLIILSNNEKLDQFTIFYKGANLIISGSTDEVRLDIICIIELPYCNNRLVITVVTSFGQIVVLRKHEIFCDRSIFCGSDCKTTNDIFQHSRRARSLEITCVNMS